MKKIFFSFFFIASMAHASILIGSSKGLFLFEKNTWHPVWTNGSVYQIISLSNAFLLRTSEGVFLFTPPLSLLPKNNGIKTWTIQSLSNGDVFFEKKIEPLMDISVSLDNPSVWVACSKSTVYLSMNAGENWISLGSPTYRGWLSVAVQTYPSLVVWAGHALNGIFRYIPHQGWKRTSIGLFSDILYNEEISDIRILSNNNTPVVYALNNFFPRLYRYDTNWKTLDILVPDIGFASSLAFSSNAILFVSDKGIFTKTPQGYSPWEQFASVQQLCTSFRQKTESIPLAISFNGIDFNDLWAFQPANLSPRQQKAAHHRALYLPPSVVASPKKYKAIFSLMEKQNLDAIVIDMKDDWGQLRFTSSHPLLLSLGRFRPLPLATLLAEAKKRGWYTIARIVLFQDKTLATVSNGMLASWDRENQKPWQGIKTVNGEKKLIQEYWVDNYNPLVWRYNLAIAEEAIKLGFDEIQFDYVRFPTDGENLKNLTYRAKSNDMTPESLIYSFFRFIRKNIDAPISMDIYGANGWYRTSLRTYQEIDLLSEFVDVFCPMYYPSHFDQNFLAYPPEEERPYRIYFYGTLRNSWIVSQRSLVRPYVQAFKIGVSYDRKFYGPEYVQREIDGIADASDYGYTFWNMGGDYRILTNLNLR